MLNRGSTSAVHSDNPRPWAIVKPRRAHTTNIHGGNFITDNRREETIHHDNSQTINDSYNNTVFNAPVQGYVHSAKNKGAVSGFVQITNVSRPVGGSKDASPMDGPIENPPPIASVGCQSNRTDRSIDAAQMTNMSSIGPNKEVPLVVGDGSSSSSALSTKMEQEQQNLSPQMREFVKALERDAQRANAGFRPDRSYPNRNHTM